MMIGTAAEWERWSFWMMCVLIEKDLWSIISGDETSETQRPLAVTFTYSKETPDNSNDWEPPCFLPDDRVPRRYLKTSARVPDILYVKKQQLAMALMSQHVRESWFVDNQNVRDIITAHGSARQMWDLLNQYGNATGDTFFGKACRR